MVVAVATMVVAVATTEVEATAEVAAVVADIVEVAAMDTTVEAAKVVAMGAAVAAENKIGATAGRYMQARGQTLPHIDGLQKGPCQVSARSLFHTVSFSEAG